MKSRSDRIGRVERLERDSAPKWWPEAFLFDHLTYDEQKLLQAALERIVAGTGDLDAAQAEHDRLIALARERHERGDPVVDRCEDRQARIEKSYQESLLRVPPRDRFCDPVKGMLAQAEYDAAQSNPPDDA